MTRRTERILSCCPGCNRKLIREFAKGLCSRCYGRQRRANRTTEQRNQELATAREWKHNHPGYETRYKPREEQFLPRGDIWIICWGCNIEMVFPDATGLCGFCKEEMPAWEKLMAYEFPESDRDWRTYFDLLSSNQILELQEKLNLEFIHRTGLAIETLLPNLTQLYRTNGEPPKHHQSPQLRLWVDKPEKLAK